LKNGIVISYKIGFRPDASWTVDPDFPLDGLMEIFTLAFSSIECEYSPQNADGSLGSPVKGGYDVKENSII